MTTTTQPADRAATAAGQPTARLVLLFLVYLALLAWVVLWKLEVPWVGVSGMRTLKLVPFVSTADAGASPMTEVVVNALLFVPFGLYLGLLAPTWRWWKVGGVVAAASLALEVTQYVLAIGSADVTDVVVNTAGGLAGLGLLALARRRFAATTTTVLTRVGVIGSVLAVLAGGLVVASPLQFGPPDVGVGLHRNGQVPRLPERP